MSRSPHNRTLTLEHDEIPALRAKLLPIGIFKLNSTICSDCFDAFEYMPEAFCDLLILDPPYNLSKKFGSESFSRMSVANYTQWLSSLFLSLMPLLKPTASLYCCGDWLSSASIFQAASNHFHVRSRITWQRDKGRGASRNWKNASEDIWFCTVSDDYVFNLDAVKLRRKVIAPYRTEDGQPKDWDASGKYRDTFPSNLWTDITIPFWSMPENTSHPTQKPEKLIAKLILASSNPGDVVLDPMCGVGTSSVVAKKLGRNYIGIEADEHYAMLAEKRLMLAEHDKRIQGYTSGTESGTHGIFYERNSAPTTSSRSFHGAI